MSKTTAVSIVVLLLFLSATGSSLASFELQGGVRMMGMGGAFVALGNDAETVQVNPAGLWFLDRYYFTVSYLRQYMGLTSNHLGYSYFSFVSPMGKGGAIGIYNGFLDCGYYRENEMGVGYGYGLGKHFSFGVTGKIFWLFYAENEDTSQDPFFRQFGFDKRNFGVDVGLMFKPSSLFSLGITARNLNQPNISLDPNSSDKIPLKVTLGASAKLGMFTPLADVEYINQKLNGKKQIRYHLGMEARMLGESLAFRGGVENKQISTGMGYTFGSADGFQFSVDYAFLYPFQSIKSTYGSHNLGISLAFGKKEKKPKGLRHFEFAFPGKDITTVTVDTVKEIEPEKVFSSAELLLYSDALTVFGLNPDEQEVYSYLQVSSNIPQEDVEKVEIRFRVSKQWLEVNKIDPASLKLLRQDDITGKTEELAITQVGTDATYLYFVATSKVL
jgi:PGF-pre-PGF domain-containing protein